jgi:hypothetical protein
MTPARNHALQGFYGSDREGFRVPVKKILPILLGSPGD